MVEPQPSKLMARVRFPSPAPMSPLRIAVGRFQPIDESADVAQLVEHVLGKDEVTGSIPVVSSSFAVTPLTTQWHVDSARGAAEFRGSFAARRKVARSA